MLSFLLKAAFLCELSTYLCRAFRRGVSLNEVSSKGGAGSDLAIFLQWRLRTKNGLWMKNPSTISDTKRPNNENKSPLMRPASRKYWSMASSYVRFQDALFG